MFCVQCVLSCGLPTMRSKDSHEDFVIHFTICVLVAIPILTIWRNMVILNYHKSMFFKRVRYALLLLFLPAV